MRLRGEENFKKLEVKNLLQALTIFCKKNREKYIAGDFGLFCLKYDVRPFKVNICLKPLKKLLAKLFN